MISDEIIGTKPKTTEEILSNMKYPIKEAPLVEVTKKKKVTIIKREKKPEEELITITPEVKKVIQEKPKEDTPKITEVTQADIIGTNLKAKFQELTKPNDRILINMEMVNGDTRTFFVEVKGETFKYKNGSYVFDTKLKYYNSSFKSYCLDYHQNLSLPFKREIDIYKCKEGINAIDDSLSTSLNPLVLTNALESKVVKDVVAGSSFEEALKLFKILLIVGVVVGVLHFILFVKASGILDNINLPI